MAIKKPASDALVNSKVVEQQPEAQTKRLEDDGTKAGGNVTKFDPADDPKYAGLPRPADNVRGNARVMWLEKKLREREAAKSTVIEQPVTQQGGESSELNATLNAGVLARVASGVQTPLTGAATQPEEGGDKRPSQPPIDPVDFERTLAEARARSAQVKAGETQPDGSLTALAASVVTGSRPAATGSSAPPPPPAELPSKVTTQTGIKVTSPPDAPKVVGTLCTQCAELGIMPGARYCLHCGFDTRPDTQEWYLLGSDGKEYGPFAKSRVGDFLVDGQAKGDTKARKEGALEWKSIGEIPELAPLLPPKPDASVVAKASEVLAPVVKTVTVVPPGHARFVPPDMRDTSFTPIAPSVTADACSKCGTPRKLPTDKNCRSCGTPHSAPAPIQQSVADPCKCGKCGALKRLPTDRNCRQCGTPYPANP